MKKRCIVLIDFSEYSENLLKYASEWAKKIEAELLIVHKTSISTPSFTSQESEQKFIFDEIEETQYKLKEYCKRFISTDVTTKYQVKEDSLINQLNDLIKGSYQDLIFIGIKGTGFLKRIFIGSEAIRIIDSIENTIIALPKQLDSYKLEKIHIAVSEEFNINTLALSRFLSLFEEEDKIKLNFFHFSKSKKESPKIAKYFKELEMLFSKDFVVSFNNFYVEGNKIDHIKEVITNKKDKELIVLQKGSRYLSDQLFRKLLINELVYEGQTPLIVLP